jgi:5-carboxymethyl-2-hydroxymuconate isomerase
MIIYRVNFTRALTATQYETSLPHLIVEYSANIEHKIALDDLLDKLHASALRSGIFPLGGLRVRAVRMEHYRIADCHPDNGYVHMTAIVGHGRPLDVRQRVGEELFATLSEHLDQVFRAMPLAISFYMQEAHPQLSFKKNNLHEHVPKPPARQGTDA